MIVDPYFNPAFSQFCYTFQYMPGSTTYLDTPVVAIAAFTTPVHLPGGLRGAAPHADGARRAQREHAHGDRALRGRAIQDPGDQIRIRSMG